jgi:heme/copper-type cytochrome/quinol oxidase subunit 4
MPGWVEKTSDGQPLVNRGRWLEVIMYSLTILAVIMLVSNVIKVRLALVEFLPLYVVFVIWKGCKFVHIEEQNVGIFMVSAIASLLGSVYVLSAILKALI